MNVTVSEAMRIKKEIATEIQNIETGIYYSVSSRLKRAHVDNVSYGVRYEDDTLMMDEGKVCIETKIEEFQKLLSMSEVVNTVLANFNHDNEIGSMVRSRQNLALMLKFYDQQVMANSVPSVKSEKDKDSGKITVVRFDPILSKSDIRTEVKNIKKSMRELQSQIEALNSKKVDLPFTFDDLDSVIGR
jgi:hypothetical protein